MRTGELRQTEDVAALLKDEQGTFLVRHAGHAAVVTSERGHSITSWRSAGAPEPINILPGANPQYQVFKLSNQILRNEEDFGQSSGLAGYQEARQQQMGRNS